MHGDCEDGQRLLDAYVRALNNVDAIHHLNGGRDRKAVRNACDELVAARRRYWTHVRKHQCRTSDSAVSSDGESS